MSKVSDAVLSLVFCILQAILVIIVIVALAGNRWIEDVESTDDAGYFQQMQNMDEFAWIEVGAEVRFLGFFRMETQEGKSYPLPIRDSELDHACYGYVLSIVLGFVALFIMSFQVFGLYTENIVLDMTIFWSVVIQIVLNLVSTSVAVFYFKQTFRRFDRFGINSHMGWVSVAVGAILLVVISIRVLITFKNGDHNQKMQRKYVPQSSMPRGQYDTAAKSGTGGSRSELRPAAGAQQYASPPRSHQGSQPDLRYDNGASPPRGGYRESPAPGSYRDSPMHGSPRNNRYYDDADAPRFAMR